MKNSNEKNENCKHDIQASKAVNTQGMRHVRKVASPDVNTTAVGVLTASTREVGRCLATEHTTIMYVPYGALV